MPRYGCSFYDTGGGDPRGGPFVPIIVHGRDGTDHPAMGIVDTGADCSSLPLPWAPLFGYTEADLIPEIGSTVHGKVRVLHDPAGIEISLDAPHIASHRVLIAARFQRTWPFIVLGRDDFLRHFKATIDVRAGMTYLEPYDEPDPLGDRPWPTPAEYAKPRGASTPLAAGQRQSSPVEPTSSDST